MKKFLIALNIVIWSFVGYQVTAHAEAVVKEVCTPKVDKSGKPVLDKAGKQAEDCKKIKTHKKVEGDKVPDGKK
jgi:hypothetical protein